MTSAPRLPPALRPGDRIAVVAPSSPFEHVLAWRALGFLAERYRLRFDRGLFSARGYLAGDDARRETELASALADPDVHAILAARGGYGAGRFCHRLDWQALARAPKWIIGFSDITALHVEAARVGVASLHAPNLTPLGRSDARARAEFIAMVEDPNRERVWSGLDVITKGVAEGHVYGGNLALLHACAAAGRLAVPEGAILLLEDVTERPYRLDRMLAGLAVGGHFARAAGVLVGELYGCAPGPDGVTAEAVFSDHLKRLGVPVVTNVPVGHGDRNEPIVLGGRARIDAGPTSATVIVGG